MQALDRTKIIPLKLVGKPEVFWEADVYDWAIFECYCEVPNPLVYIYNRLTHHTVICLDGCERCLAIYGRPYLEAAVVECRGAYQ